MRSKLHVFVCVCVCVCVCVFVFVCMCVCMLPFGALCSRLTDACKYLGVGTAALCYTGHQYVIFMYHWSGVVELRSPQYPPTGSYLDGPTTRIHTLSPSLCCHHTITSKIALMTKIVFLTLALKDCRLMIVSHLLGMGED